jgi:hypothetical protein
MAGHTAKPCQSSHPGGRCGYAGLSFLPSNIILASFRKMSLVRPRYLSFVDTSLAIQNLRQIALKIEKTFNEGLSGEPVKARIPRENPHRLYPE